MAVIDLLRRPTGRAKVWSMTGALALVALIFTVVSAGDGRYDESIRLPWLVLATMFALTEIHIVNVQFRRETQSFSLSELPLVLGLFFATPLEVVTAQIVGAGVALIAHRRQPAVKWTFNLAHLALEAAVAVLVFRAIADHAPALGATEIVATFAATVTAIVLGVLSVVGAIALAEGKPKPNALARVLAIATIGTVTNTALVLTAVVFLRVHPAVAWLLVVPVATLMVAYRGYSSSRTQHETLEQLYDATRSMQRSLGVEPVMKILLERARELFRAERATVMLFPGAGDETALEYALDDDGAVRATTSIMLDPTEGVWARVAAERQGVLLPRPIPNDRLRQLFQARSVRDLMVAPVYGDGGVVGTITVANRVSDIETFTSEDLTLFETFANHVSVALENARLVTRLQDSVGDLQELHRLKDEFLATVSHELRTPLTSIMGFIGVMRGDPLLSEQERQEYLEVMERQSLQLRALIEDLLMAARLESNAFRPVAGRVQPWVLVKRVVEAYASWKPPHRFDVKIDEGVPELLTDEETVHRILSNLVNNAVKNSPEGSTVTVTARRDGDGVRVLVEDEGIGIPEELHDRIFERFYQVDGTYRRTVGGTGLGLYICRRLAEMIGARVALERSEPGRGSVFSVWLPLSTSRDVVPLAKPRLVADVS